MIAFPILITLLLIFGVLFFFRSCDPWYKGATKPEHALLYMSVLVLGVTWIWWTFTCAPSP